LIVDTVGNRSLLENRHALKPAGTYIGLGGGGPSEQGFIGAMSGSVEELILSAFVSQKLPFFLADMNQKDLTVLADLMRTGKITPVIDRHYELSAVTAAVTYLEARACPRESHHLDRRALASADSRQFDAHILAHNDTPVTSMLPTNPVQRKHSRLITCNSRSFSKP
jgi:hypothetical protein